MDTNEINQLFFWWSILSTLLSVIFIIVSIWQYFKSKTQEDKNKAQVKVWMQDANGISQALNRIVNDNLYRRYTSTNDVCNAVWAIQSNAAALYQSLYEERCVTEDEYKARQKKLADIVDKEQLEKLQTKKDSDKKVESGLPDAEKKD